MIKIHNHIFAKKNKIFSGLHNIRNLSIIQYEAYKLKYTAQQLCFTKQNVQL